MPASRNNEVTLPQTSVCLAATRRTNASPTPESLVQRLVRAKKTDAEIVEDLPSVPGRLPKETERATIRASPGLAAGAHLNALVDVFWAVLNSKEFAFNH